jgi:hypothetical protein
MWLGKSQPERVLLGQLLNANDICGDASYKPTAKLAVSSSQSV